MISRSSSLGSSNSKYASKRQRPFENTGKIVCQGNFCEYTKVKVIFGDDMSIRVREHDLSNMWVLQCAIIEINKLFNG